MHRGEVGDEAVDTAEDEGIGELEEGTVMMLADEVAVGKVGGEALTYGDIWVNNAVAV